MDLSSHGIVSLVRNQENKYLLLEDCRPEMQGFWAPPHGKCEPQDASEKDSVIRETLEETGLVVEPVKKVLTQPADTKIKTVSFWLVNRTGGELKVDATESSSHGWFTTEEALGLKLYPGTQAFFTRVAAGEISLLS